METFVDIISDIGAQISKIKRCRINQQTLFKDKIELYENEKQVLENSNKFILLRINQLDKQVIQLQQLINDLINMAFSRVLIVSSSSLL